MLLKKSLPEKKKTCNETFLKAIECIDSYNGSCKISTWLCQIAKHLLYQQRKKSGRVQFEETDTTIKAADNTESHAIARMELTDVWDKLQQLPPDMKKVVEFRVLGDFSYKEIGNMLGKNENRPELLFTVPK